MRLTQTAPCFSTGHVGTCTTPEARSRVFSLRPLGKDRKRPWWCGWCGIVHLGINAGANTAAREWTINGPVLRSLYVSRLESVQKNRAPLRGEGKR